jgi:hypothetical protein
VHARDEGVLEEWFLEKPASRIIVNGPSSMGAVGYSTWLMPSMSLGCGPQAGNITSDNITYKHLLNIKRAAFPRKDWQETEAKDHAWAAKFTRESAPRGSGLPGDPALTLNAPLASTSAFSASGASNWQGNAVAGTSQSPSAGKGAVPMSFVAPAKPQAVAPKVQAAPKAPMGASTATLVPPGPSAAAIATPRAPAPSSGANVGARLSTAEIQNIMAHAGAGCPLGPCKGCEHHDVSSGACLA